MSVLDRLFAMGRMRQLIWGWWYPFLTRRLRADDVLLLNYAYEEAPPLGIPLSAADESDRACLQLYHHVASQSPLQDGHVLEVSCGHGGGASYVLRTFRPRQYIGLDLNPAGVRFCQHRHMLPGLDFRTGDACALPFANASFDAVLNVEASHCYADFPRFLAEVARVLRPGGHFHYADFRFSDGIAAWEKALAEAPLKLEHTRVINAEVLRGMNRNSARSLALVQRHLPKFLHGLGRDFAGVQGSRIYNALQSGELSYRSFLMVKAEQGAGK